MTWFSNSDDSELYAFEPERFLVPPMEGFLRRIFGARWGMILVSAPEFIDLSQILDFLANFSIQSSYYSEFSASKEDFYKLEKDERKIRTIEEVLQDAMKAIPDFQITDQVSHAIRIDNIPPRNPEIVFINELNNENISNAIEASVNHRLVVAGIRAEGSFPALQLFREYVKSDHLAAASLMGIIGLNTVGRICPECRIIVEHELGNLEQFMIGSHKEKLYSYVGTGCEICDFTGYHGQILIHEGLELTENLRNKILSKMKPRHLRMIAKQEGMSTLLDAAWALAEAGETTLEEAMRTAEETDPGGTEPTSI
jgi:type II secretory ATPase GspE/PulE/Tfp pilus assembly ATPase PilB-like protein